MMKIPVFKIGEQDLYDRFPGTDPAMPGIVIGFAESAEKLFIWVDCNDEPFLCPLSKVLKHDSHNSSTPA